MCRGLFLAVLAAGLGLFGASLLRTERRASEGSGSAPAAAGACAARTRSGAPCSRPAEPGAEFCWQHG